jgi:glycosyltransferase involved in cell wall biosynthesis
MKIIFYSNSRVDYNPDIAFDKGVGGAEVVMIQATKELRQRGYEIVVYNRNKGGVYGGVTYKNINNYDNEACDVFIGFEAFPEVINSKKTINWSNRPQDSGINKFPNVDQIICVSEYHKSMFKTSPLYEKIIVIENGIEVLYFAETYAKIKHSIVYAGYPAKGGMAILPKIFEKVRQVYSDATMRVFGGGSMWGIDDDKFKKLYEELKNAGIYYEGQTGSNMLSQIMKMSEILINPLGGWHTETFGLTVGQAMASKTLVITSGEGNLGNLVGDDRGFALMGELDDSWIDRASNLIIAMFDHYDFKMDMVKRASRFIKKNTWFNAISNFEKLCLK